MPDPLSPLAEPATAAGSAVSADVRNLRGRSADPSRRNRRKRADLRTVAVLTLPFLVLFAAFYIAPILYAIWQSLFALRRSGAYRPAENVFVGLGNYAQVLTDPAFQQSLANVGLYAIGPSTLTVLIGLLIALVIDARANRLGAKLARAAVFAPYAVPAVIGATIWGFLYAPSTSPFVSAAQAIGWDVNPLAGPVVWQVGNIALWTYIGFNVLIFASGLASIDPSMLESARMDGASSLRIAWSIKLPLLRPSIVLSIVFNLIGTLQLFTEPMALRTLSNEISSVWTPNMLAYSEAAANRYSFSAAVSTLLAVVTAVFSFALLRAATRGAKS